MSTLNLITGVPGAAKTLYTIDEVEALREEKGYTVYYWRIKGVKLPWTELAPFDDIDAAREALHAMPAGSICVVDECHLLVPPRVATRAVPKYVEDFGEHRHSGHIFYLVTQVPEQIDHYVKGRVTRHVHLKRKWGMSVSETYEQSEYFSPKIRGDLNAAIRRPFLHPKKWFGMYKSADMHVKAGRFPWFVPLIVGAVLLFLFGSIWRAYNLFAVGDAAQKAVISEAPVRSAPPPVSEDDRLKAAALLWAAQWQEIVKGQPHSPEFYAAHLEPATIPRISGCMHVQAARLDRCECNTQQGTVITTISHKECKFYLRNGWFDPFKADEEDGSQSDAEEDHDMPTGLATAADGPKILNGELSL